MSIRSPCGVSVAGMCATRGLHVQVGLAGIGHNDRVAKSTVLRLTRLSTLEIIADSSFVSVLIQVELYNIWIVHGLSAGMTIDVDQMGFILLASNLDSICGVFALNGRFNRPFRGGGR